MRRGKGSPSMNWGRDADDGCGGCLRDSGGKTMSCAARGIHWRIRLSRTVGRAWVGVVVGLGKKR